MYEIAGDEMFGGVAVGELLSDTKQLHNHPRGPRPAGMTSAALYPQLPEVFKPMLEWQVYRAWKPEWHEDCGPLQIAADVTVVGEKGVEITGRQAEIVTRERGLRFESLTITHGLEIKDLAYDGTIRRIGCNSACAVNVTAVKCKFEQRLWVGDWARVVLEDCAISGSRPPRGESNGMEVAKGNVKATRCTFETVGRYLQYGRMGGGKVWRAKVYRRSGGVQRCEQQL